MCGGTKVKGGVYYNRNKYIDGSVQKTVKLFEENYKSDPTKYLKSIAEHTVTMYNAICVINGYQCNMQFDEKMFYTNEQLKQNNSSIVDYAKKNEKMPYVNVIGTRQKCEINSRNNYLLNPMVFVDMYYTDGTNRKNMPEKYKYGIFDYNVENKVAYSYAIAEDMFKIWNKVSLTSEETQKLNNARKYYKTAMDLFNANTGSVYKTTPVEDTPQNLYAGELNNNMKNAANAYYNIIRAGSGLSTVSQSKEGETQAQAKAVLLSYRKKKLGLQITHSPEKPEGVTTSFYNTAIGYGQKSLAESVAWSNNLEASPYAIMKYIKQFMDDSSEYPFNISHRTSLLIPSNSAMGYGIANSIGVMEIEHDSSSTIDAEMVAWPAKGVTLLETLDNYKFKWSAQFRKRYKIKNTTTVSVKCIQTGETWVWDTVNTGGDHYFRRDVTGLTEYKNRVIFGDKSLVPQPGFVYEITINDITDENTNKTINYTYRAVFEYGDASKNSASSTKVSIDAKDLKNVTGENKTYYIPVGKQIDLDAIIDENITDKKLTWSSSNSNAKITQNGSVLLDKNISEKIAITVTHDATKASDTIYLKAYEDVLLGDVNQDKKINAKDAKMVLKHFVGKIKLDDEQKVAADVNKDNKINQKDAKLILKYFVGKIKQF